MFKPIAFALTLLVALIASLAFASASQQPQKVRLALNWKPEPQFGGFYAAQLGGAFQNAGLNVEILPGGSGTPTVQMVDNGRAEFGIVSADELVKLRARGGDVVALFAVFQTNPQGLMTHEARGLKSLKELLESPGTVAWQAGLPYVTHFKRNYDLARLRQVPYTGGLPFLNSPDFAQQCFIISEPILAKQQGHKVATFLVADSGYNPYTTVVIARGATVRDNPKLVADFTKAVQAGWTAYLADPAATNDAMRKLNPTMDARTFAESAEAQKPLMQTEETLKNGLGSMTAQRWKTLIDQLHTYREIETPIDPAACFIPLP
jgi:NitT/TauT family transport system substrate-binding protein